MRQSAPVPKCTACFRILHRCHIVLTLMELKESTRRPLTNKFKCSESIEVDGAITSVIFHCNLKNGTKLEFNCREPSCGALEGGEEAATLTDEDYTVDPNFFDEGYSMAGKTGFKVWTGSRLLIETLAWPQPGSDNSRLTEIQNRLAGGARVLELGAGVGVVGTYLAAIGANVLLTDLPTLVENAIDCNLLRNKFITASSGISVGGQRPTWLAPNGYNIGKGWADSTPVDWTFPIEEQLSDVQSESVDFIVASDVVFLVQMLNSLLVTVDALFKSSSANNPSFILSFQRRDAKDGEESVSFTTVNRVLLAVKERGWSLDCIAWRPVTVSKEYEDQIVKEESEVFVFEIKP